MSSKLFTRRFTFAVAQIGESEYQVIRYEPVNVSEKPNMRNLRPQKANFINAQIDGVLARTTEETSDGYALAISPELCDGIQQRIHDDTFSAGRYDDLLLNTPAATGSFEITIPQGMVLKSVETKGLDWWDRYTVKLTSDGNAPVWATREMQATNWETLYTNWTNPSETVTVNVENLDGSAHWFGVWKVSFLTFTYGPPD